MITTLVLLPIRTVLISGGSYCSFSLLGYSFYNIFSEIIFSPFNANSMYPFISLMLLSKRKLEPNLNVPNISFWPCQRNLIKTFQTEANTYSTDHKNCIEFFLTFLVEVIRPAQLQNSDFQSHFSMSKNIWIFLKSRTTWNRSMIARRASLKKVLIKVLMVVLIASLPI